MRKTWNLLLVSLLALPALAQETPPDESGSAPVDEPAATESAPAADAEAAPAEGATAEAPAEAPTETPAEAPTETAAAEEPVAEATPWALYGGFDYVLATLSSSRLSGFAAEDYDTGMYRLRFGSRVLDAVGLEAQFGLGTGGDGAGEAKTKSYYGVFAVPTATVFETVELAFPVGYAFNQVESGGASASMSSIAYGADAELPLKVFGDLPDVRITLGWMIYHQKVPARIYGANLGVRYDFTTSSLGNPFGGIGSFLKGLWPFGD
jgi:hypothetical protein